MEAGFSQDDNLRLPEYNFFGKGGDVPLGPQSLPGFREDVLLRPAYPFRILKMRNELGQPFNAYDDPTYGKGTRPYRMMVPQHDSDVHGALTQDGVHALLAHVARCRHANSVGVVHSYTPAGRDDIFDAVYPRTLHALLATDGSLLDGGEVLRAVYEEKVRYDRLYNELYRIAGEICGGIERGDGTKVLNSLKFSFPPRAAVSAMVGKHDYSGACKMTPANFTAYSFCLDKSRPMMPPSPKADGDPAILVEWLPATALSSMPREPAPHQLIFPRFRSVFMTGASEPVVPPDAIQGLVPVSRVVGYYMVDVAPSVEQLPLRSTRVAGKVVRSLAPAAVTLVDTFYVPDADSFDATKLLRLVPVVFKPAPLALAQVPCGPPPPPPASAADKPRRGAIGDAVAASVEADKNNAAAK